MEIGTCRFAQLTVDSGKWTVVVSPSGMDLNNRIPKFHIFLEAERIFESIYFKLSRRDSLTVHCQLGRSPANSNLPR